MGERADAFAIHREGLRERAGNEELQTGRGEQVERHGVFRDAIGKALVGHVDEGHQTAGADDVDDFFPLRFGEVGAGRVVTAGMQHDDGILGHRFELGFHAGEIDAASGRVVIRVGTDLESGGFEQRTVVFPARVADIGLGVRQEALQEIGADFQRTGAAERFGGDHAAFGEERRILAEQQGLYGLVIGAEAFDGLVATCRHRLQTGFFGDFDGAEQRDFSVVIEIDTDAQIDFAGARVRVESFV